ncbi:MAG: diguanylate cyclase [Actinomycetota bacterium]|nr:diguanylate cyclase [Actinomycetota bacterium]
MQSWSSLSDEAGGESSSSSSIIRRLVESSRRAEIIALVNCARDETEIAMATVNELCEALEGEIAFVIVTRPSYGERETIGQIGLTAEQASALSTDDRCRAALGSARAELHTGSNLLGLQARHLVLSPWTADKGRQVVIGVARLYDEAFDPAEVALLETVTTNVGHALERSWLAAERDRHALRQSALAHAARELSASLEGGAVLQTLADQIAGTFQPDVVAIYVAGDDGAMEIAAGVDVPPLAYGTSCAASGGLCAEVELTSEAQLRQPFEARPAAELPGLPALSSGAAAPIRPFGAVAAVALIGYTGDRWIDPEDVELLSAFAELGTIAWRNAVDHAAVRREASLDSLTGCLNHGAFQDRLREEISRAERNRTPLALVLMDLNEFKAINDCFGHLAGDALLRGVADALRESVRPYDKVARYGGDEFALLLPNTDEDTARRVLDRALAAVARVELPGKARVSASAGLAQRRPNDDPSSMIERADTALLELKRARGGTSRSGDSLIRHRVPEPDEQQLRRLASAGSLGTRLARNLDQRAIAEIAIIELSGTLGYNESVLARSGPRDELVVVAKGSVGSGQASDGQGSQDERVALPTAVAEALHRCLRERQTILFSRARARSGERNESEPGAELAVPVYVGAQLWGALAVHSENASRLGESDARIVQTVADQLGAALHTAKLYEQLDETHLGTAAALAAALEAKDHYTADHARSIADLAVAVGASLGLSDDDLRDLRYGAIFHDIGKIAIPDAILNKPGPLDESELAVIRQHPEVGEQILAPVPLFAGVRQIVRHDHERWDGRGYPDGLEGETIPLGARIVLAVDAYHAMRSDRPYRRSMSAADARLEMLANAGSQFDARVVGALLTILEQVGEAH